MTQVLRGTHYGVENVYDASSREEHTTLIHRIAGKACSRKFALLRVGLLLDDRLCWLKSGYRVCTPMHYLPSALFRSKDARRPQSEWGNILPSANLGLQLFYLDNVGKPKAHMLRNVLKANDLALSVIRCGTLHTLSNLLPPTRAKAKGVSEAYVFSTGVHHLQGFRVPFEELA